MSLQDLREALQESAASKWFDNLITEKIHAELQARSQPKRWLSQAAYARYYGTSVTSVWRKTDDLRKLGAVIGESKSIRYDLNFTPDGQRVSGGK